jgi:hypothetical protein
MLFVHYLCVVASMILGGIKGKKIYQIFDVIRKLSMFMSSE